MTVADTSREAFRALDVNGVDAKVLAFFSADPHARWTRQDVADKTGILLQTVCGAVARLVEAGHLEALAERVLGRHLVRIKQVSNPALPPTDTPPCVGEASGSLHQTELPFGAVHPRDEDRLQREKEACLIRWLANFPSDRARADWFKKYAEKHGERARDTLRRKVWNYMRQERKRQEEAA